MATDRTIIYKQPFVAPGIGSQVDENLIINCGLIIPT